MRGHAALLSVAGALALVPACGVAHHDIGALKFSQRLSRDVDVLVVLDTSPVMDGTRAQLGPAIGGLAGAIVSASDPLASFHVGFISSDMGMPGSGSHGDDGALVTSVNCTVDGPFISFEDGRPNYVGTLEEQLNCLFAQSNLGSGSDVQQPFAAVMRALDGSQPLNQGFLRENADLLVIFVASQDDCSLSPGHVTGDAGTVGGDLSTPYQCARHGVMCDQELPATLSPMSLLALTGCETKSDGVLIAVPDLTSFLQEPKSFEGQVAVMVVAGPTEPFVVRAPDSTASTAQEPAIDRSCTQPQALWGALPPVRLQQLADDFRDELRGTGTSTCLCSGDTTSALPSCAFGALSDRMTSAARTMLARGRCLNHAPRFVTRDAGPPVAQCQVTRLDEPADSTPDAGAMSPADAGATSLPSTIPACAEDPAPPCWRVIPNRTDCIESGFAVEIVGPQGTWISGGFEINCFL